MEHLTRRNFMKLAAASGAALAVGEGTKTNALAGDVEVQSGKDFSPKTGKERKAIPSCCWQCVTRCPNVGFVEDGRLVKIEGNPKSIRTEGIVCAKGQAAVNQYTDPDRILYEERDSATVDASGNPFSTDPDRVGVGIIAGSIESGRVPWLQFTVTCGDEAAPWLVTPQITREDLEKMNGDYRYVVE